MGPAREIRKAAKRLSLADARGFANLAKTEGRIVLLATHRDTLATRKPGDRGRTRTYNLGLRRPTPYEGDARHC